MLRQAIATTAATNATTSAVRGGNQSTSEVREYIEAACMAAQNNDTQGVRVQLNLALNELGGNMTTSAGGEDEGEDAGEMKAKQKVSDSVVLR